MLKKQKILAVYQKGPQVICDFVHQLENRSKKSDFHDAKIGFNCPSFARPLR
ncbi:hypothetical protein [Bacillus cereus]|uniref:hypothetical protein n=1 Tax=Bacillus cereus TaxID=1396 RepID=UPI0015D51397|nr:hypothetical protein [Bacillus cereus]